MSTSRPLAVVVGFIGKLPYAGMTLYNLHYIAGLQALGYRVHYVERLNQPDECYDPRRDMSVDDPAYALDYLGSLLPRFGIDRDGFSFIDRQDRCHGSGEDGLAAVLDVADFVLTLSDPTWFAELERCPRRAFVDGDPLFTQAAMTRADSPMAEVLGHYDTLFTYAMRLGAADCSVPAAQRTWISTRPVVATALWEPLPPDRALPLAALLHWAAGGDVHHEGRVYGHKSRELERLVDLPQRLDEPVVLAVGGPAPRDRLREHGWQLVDPLVATTTLESYRRFIAGSRADLGIAKHAYVASRCGWFSDRSTCYLASGRPVLHQDTGFQDWLPAGEGVLPFAAVDDLLDALHCLDADYDRHAKAARQLALEHFEAAKVVGTMLDDGHLR